VKNLLFKILLIIFLFPFKLAFSNHVLLSSYSFSNLLLKLAESEYEKKMGLMYLDKLVDVEGMFFIYKKPKIIKMWMHNTKIPLDIIFIDESKKVISINNGIPFSKRIISSKTKAVAVIEIPHKCSKKLKIKKGDKINWSTIKNKKNKNIRYYHCLAK
tara:strand:+ start:110 stop:583 length:474 start_codon:yes stop_codon:yes gene_type:complete